MSYKPVTVKAKFEDERTKEITDTVESTFQGDVKKGEKETRESKEECKCSCSLPIDEKINVLVDEIKGGDKLYVYQRVFEAPGVYLKMGGLHAQREPFPENELQKEVILEVVMHPTEFLVGLKVTS